MVTDNRDIGEAGSQARGRVATGDTDARGATFGCAEARFDGRPSSVDSPLKVCDFDSSGRKPCLAQGKNRVIIKGPELGYARHFCRYRVDSERANKNPGEVS